MSLLPSPAVFEGRHGSAGAPRAARGAWGQLGASGCRRPGPGRRPRTRSPSPSGRGAPLSLRSGLPAAALAVAPHEQRTTRRAGPAVARGLQRVVDPSWCSRSWRRGRAACVSGSALLLMPLYQPVVLGKLLASLDLISGGRLDVGLGIGWSDEFEASACARRRPAGASTSSCSCLKAVWADMGRSSGASSTRWRARTWSPGRCSARGRPMLDGRVTAPACSVAPPWGTASTAATCHSPPWHPGAGGRRQPARPRPVTYAWIVVTVLPTRSHAGAAAGSAAPLWGSLRKSGRTSGATRRPA